MYCYERRCDDMNGMKWHRSKTMKSEADQTIETRGSVQNDGQCRGSLEGSSSKRFALQCDFELAAMTFAQDVGYVRHAGDGR